MFDFDSCSLQNFAERHLLRRTLVVYYGLRNHDLWNNVSRTLTAIWTYVRYTATHFVKKNTYLFLKYTFFALFDSLFSIKIRKIRILKMA